MISTFFACASICQSTFDFLSPMRARHIFTPSIVTPALPVQLSTFMAKRAPIPVSEVLTTKTLTPSHADPLSTVPLAPLLAAVGPADSALREAFLAGTSDAALVDVGRTILSARVITDGVRLYNEANDFWQGASPLQRMRLRGFSMALLAVAVHELAVLTQLEARHAGREDAADRERLITERSAESTCGPGIDLRDLAAVEVAKGTADDGEKLSRGLASLAKLLTDWLASADTQLKGRLFLGNLTSDLVDELTTAGEAVRSTTEGARRRPTGGKVTHGELDRADGINMLLLTQIIRAFDGAHALDPTIPRLRPIATRRLFNRTTSSKKKAPPVAPATGATGKNPPV